jgi:hypothetical protein
MQKVCQSCPHSERPLCHKPIVKRINNLHKNGRGLSSDALFLCATVMDMDGTKKLIITYHLIAARLQGVGFLNRLRVSYIYLGFDLAIQIVKHHAILR